MPYRCGPPISPGRMCDVSWKKTAGGIWPRSCPVKKRKGPWISVVSSFTERSAFSFQQIASLPQVFLESCRKLKQKEAQRFQAFARRDEGNNLDVEMEGSQEADQRRPEIFEVLFQRPGKMAPTLCQVVGKTMSFANADRFAGAFTAQIELRQNCVRLLYSSGSQIGVHVPLVGYP